MHLPILIVSTAALILLGAFRIATAEPSLTFTPLRTTGPAPSIDFFQMEKFDQIRGIRFDPIGQRFHVVLGEHWYRMDLKTREWTRHTIQQPTELEVPSWNVIPGTSTLLAWDAGVGRVVRIDSSGESRRIDRSFNHRNQYNHISYVDPAGHIFAIGGTGLFSIKNFAVHYFPESGTWHRSTGHELLLDDPMMSGGYAIRDPRNPVVFIVTETPTEGDPSTRLLIVDLVTGQIDPIHQLSPIPRAAWYESKWNHPMSSSVFDGSHGFGFLHASDSWVSNNSPTTLGILDFQTHRFARRDAMLPKNTHPSFWHLVLHYDETDSTLYSLSLSHVISDTTLDLMISSAKIDVDAIRATLKKGIEPNQADTTIGVHAIAAIIGALMILVLVGGFTFGRRKSTLSAAPSYEAHPDVVPLNLCLNPLCLNGRRWEDLFGTDFPLEAKLLELLTNAMANGQPVLSSDIVDRQLIPHHPSPDYIRKTRNLTRKRLEESLQSAFPTSEGQSYILTHREVLDKRKTKLQLNPKCVVIHPPESASRSSEVA